MHDLTMQELAEKIGVSKQMISKYGRSCVEQANKRVLKHDFFYRDESVVLGEPIYHAGKLTKAQKESVLAKAQEWAERLVEAENLLLEEPSLVKLQLMKRLKQWQNSFAVFGNWRQIPSKI